MQIFALVLLPTASVALQCHYIDPKVQPTEKNVTCEYATTKFCYKFVTDTKTPKVYRGCANEASTAPDSAFIPGYKDASQTPCKKDGYLRMQGSIGGFLGGNAGEADLYCCSKDFCNSAESVTIGFGVIVLMLSMFGLSLLRTH
ncbi:hypothetical protein AAVH_34820 [Aphelenchoides avenae]|nr:hypothetical protein AAVH_34820 [Aphelenchus avenae]